MGLSDCGQDILRHTQPLRRHTAVGDARAIFRRGDPSVFALRIGRRADWKGDPAVDNEDIRE